MSRGRVLFVGCGPGAPDLLTLRAVRALEAADIVIWSPSILDRQALATHTRGGTEVVEWPPATHDDVLRAYERAVADELLVVRLKGGDPMLFGEIEPELSEVRARGLECEIVPGISALGASAAAAGYEIARPGAPLLLVDAATIADVRDAAVGVAAYGAGRDPRALQAALLHRGLPGSTPCAVAIEVSRRDETLVSCPLDELAETVEDMGLGLLTLVLAGASPPEPGARHGRAA
ncbi:MAG: SAM-dependent methyltransferase [Solirubrobacteraceae bacterium]